MDYAIVPVAQRQLAGRAVPKGVVSIGVGARLIGDHLVFAVAIYEQIVFDQGVGVGKTSAAQSDLERLSAVTADAAEILEQVVMDPCPLRHSSAARSANREHLTHGAFILEGVVIDISVIRRDQQIYPIARELENVAGDPAMIGSGLRLHCSNGVG